MTVGCGRCHGEIRETDNCRLIEFQCKDSKTIARFPICMDCYGTLIEDMCGVARDS